MDILNISRSRLRQKLLAYFFTNPDSNLYVREIASILGEDAGNISKELYKLKNTGIFTSSKRGNQKYYSLNKKSPLYPELCSIIFKTIGVEGALRKLIESIDGIRLSFIYGSFAQSKENKVSDIDLLIVGRPDQDKLIREIEALEKKLQRQINYNIYPTREFREKFRKKDSFIVNIVKRPKILLRGSMDEIC